MSNLLNGGPVIAEKNLGDHRAVLVYLPDSLHQYVVSTTYLWDDPNRRGYNGWHQGHYFERLHEAVEYFVKRFGEPDVPARHRVAAAS